MNFHGFYGYFVIGTQFQILERHVSSIHISQNLLKMICDKQLVWEQFPDNRQSEDSKEKEFGKNQNDQETTNTLAVESLSRRQKVSINFGMS